MVSVIFCDFMNKNSNFVHNRFIYEAENIGKISVD